MTSDLERKRSTRLSAKPVSQTPSFSGFVREAGTSIRRSFTALEKSGKREDKQSLQADVSSIEVADSPPGEDGGEDGHESDGSSSTGSYESQERPFPNLNYTSLFIFHQMTPPRNIAIKMVRTLFTSLMSFIISRGNYNHHVLHDCQDSSWDSFNIVKNVGRPSYFIWWETFWSIFRSPCFLFWSNIFSFFVNSYTQDITMQRYTQIVTGRYARCVYLVFVFTILIQWKWKNIAENSYFSRNWRNGREYRIPCSQKCPNFSREIQVHT